MRGLKINRKLGLIAVTPENLEDLWNITRLLEKGDIAIGTATRKVGSENQKAERVKVFAKIEIENWQLEKYSQSLKISGKIKEGKPEEYMPLGSSQALTFQPGFEFKLQKQKIKSYQADLLQKAIDFKGKVFILLIDDEGSELYSISNFSTTKEFRIASKKSGKYLAGENWRKTFFERILNEIKNKEIERIVIAGPGFEKNNLSEILKEKLPKLELIVESANHVGKQGVKELISGKKQEKLFKEFGLQDQEKTLENLLEHLGKSSGLAAIGEKETQQASQNGAIETLLVLDDYLLDNQQIAGKIMEHVDNIRGKIVVFNSTEDAGKKLKGFNGIAAILKFKLF